MYEKAGVKKYEGEFKDNKPNGEGKLYHIGCEKVHYEGSWLDGYPSGRGRLFSVEGEVLQEGEF